MIFKLLKLFNNKIYKFKKEKLIFKFVISTLIQFTTNNYL